MALATLQRALSDIRRLGLDTTVFLVAADPADPRQRCCRWLLKQVERGTYQATISSINAAELFVGAYRRGPQRAVATQAYLRIFPNLSIAPFTIELASEAGHLRAVTSLKLPDAIVLATAFAHGAQAVVHADKEWAKKAASYQHAVRLIYLGDHCP